jgi:hypothetical protein
MNMPFLCKKHVKEGLNDLYLPHVQKTVLDHKCNFCNNRAEFQMGLFFVPKNKRLINKF